MVVAGRALRRCLDWTSVVFLSPDRIRIYLRRDAASARAPFAEVEILEFDARTRMLETTGRIEGLRRPQLHPELSLRSLLILERTNIGDRVFLCNPRTGDTTKTLLPLMPESQALLMDVSTVSDGRIILATREPNGARLRVFSEDGGEESRIDLPEQFVRLGG